MPDPSVFGTGVLPRLARCENIPHRRTTSADARFHCTHRPARRISDLAVLHICDIPIKHCSSLFVRQRLERLPQRPAQFHVEQVFVQRAITRLGRKQIAQRLGQPIQRCRWPPLPLAQVIEAGAPRDHTQPGGELAALAVSAQPLPGLDERLLHQVVGVGHANDPSAGCAHPRLMTQHQDIERVQPPVQCDGDQFVVVERTELEWPSRTFHQCAPLQSRASRNFPAASQRGRRLWDTACMPLVDPGPIIAQAHERGVAVIGANVSTIQMLRGVVRAAEDAQRPVLIQFNRSGLSLIGGVDIAAHVVRSIAEHSHAEIALHLDHADTLDELSAAINAGFGSVMIDGSTLPFDQHLTLAQSAKGLVTWSRLPLEAELGHVAGDEAGVTIGDASWTDPDEAARFVEATGVDWLAVAVGNTHGGPAAGGLQAQRLRAIAASVGVPLVLHGASGLTDEELAQAVELGVAKINVGTALHRAAAGGMNRWLADHPNDLRGALMQSEVAVREATAALLSSTWVFGN